MLLAHSLTRPLAQVPTAYYAVLAGLALFIMLRISTELRSQSNRPLKDVDSEERVEREMAEVGGGELLDTSGLLRTHLDDSRFELYVPPLTTTLLNATYEQSAERGSR